MLGDVLESDRLLKVVELAEESEILRDEYEKVRKQMAKNEE